MSQRTGLLNVQLRDSKTQQVWKAAEQAVAEELEQPKENLTRAEVARELAEAYCGGEPCGKWKNGESDD